MNINKYDEIIKKSYRLKITHLNDQGYGVASNLLINKIIKKKIVLIVPGTLAGEIILAKPIKIINEKMFFRISKVLTSDQNRKKQDCKKFLICGGCDFRHVNELWLQNYKLMDLNDFNKKLKIKFQVLPIFQSNNYSRQRASFAGEIKNGEIKIGFISIFENQIVELNECKTLNRSLLKIFQSFKSKLSNFIIKKNFKFKIQINLLQKGGDVLFDLHSFSAEEVFYIDELLNFLISINVIRVSFKQNSHLSIFPFNNEHKNDLGTLNGIKLYSFPQPGGFLQATKSGERNIIKYVLSAVKGSTKVIDLFCGSGTISIPLNQITKTICVDSNKAALEGLSKGLKFNTSKHKYEIIHQDLLKRPIEKKLLNEVDSIVLNPPFKGAKNQINEIIKSDVDIVVYVSCNFKTFERDAKVLLSNDFMIDWIKPIDQFPYTNHLENVAKFVKIR